MARPRQGAMWVLAYLEPPAVPLGVPDHQGATALVLEVTGTWAEAELDPEAPDQEWPAVLVHPTAPPVEGKAWGWYPHSPAVQRAATDQHGIVYMRPI